MIPHIGVTQGIMENIDPNELMISTGIIKATNETVLGRLIDSGDTNHEARTYSETTHAIVITTHAHQAFLALEIDDHAGVANIHAQIYPSATCRVSDVAVHSKTLADHKFTLSLEQI